MSQGAIAALMMEPFQDVAQTRAFCEAVVAPLRDGTTADGQALADFFATAGGGIDQHSVSDMLKYGSYQ